MRRALCAVFVVVSLLALMTTTALAENRPILSVTSIQR